MESTKRRYLRNTSILGLCGISGCLRLQRTDRSEGDDQDTSSPGEVDLEILESFDLDIRNVWYDGTMLYGSGVGTVAAFDPDEVRWENDVSGYRGERALASKTNTVVFGLTPLDASTPDATAQFRAYNSTDGSSFWEFTAPEDGVHIHPRGAVIINDLAVVGSNKYGVDFEPEPLISGLDIDNGELVWERDLSDQGVRYLSGIWTYNDRICVGTSSDGYVLLNPENGDIIEKSDSIVASYTTGKTVARNRFISVDDGSISVYNLSDETKIWTKEIDGRPWFQPVVDSELILVGTGSGKVYAFERGSGELRWENSVNVKVVSIASSPDNIWVATSDSSLTAFDRNGGSVVHQSVRNVKDMHIINDRILLGGKETHIATIS